MNFELSSHNAWLMSERELEERRRALLRPGQSVNDLIAAELRTSVPTLRALRQQRSTAAAAATAAPTFSFGGGAATFRATNAAVNSATRGVAEFDDDVLDSCGVFFKRYCTVHNITQAVSPHTVLYTCLFVALKVEERRLTVEELVAKLASLSHPAVPVPVAADIIFGEPKLLAALRFRLHVFHPFTALRGHLSVVAAANPAAATSNTSAVVFAADLRAFNQAVEKSIVDESRLDHALVLPPSLRALATLVRQYHKMPDDQNPTFDVIHRYLSSQRFRDATGLASLKDPAFQSLVALSARLLSRSQQAAPELFDIEPLHVQ